MDIAVVGVGVDLSLDKNGTCIAARVALGAVAEKAILVKDAANAIVQTDLNDKALTLLANAARAACRPIDDKRGTKEFRREVAGVLACRAAKISFERARIE